MSGVILITGATSGIGRAAARRFAGAGWKVGTMWPARRIVANEKSRSGAPATV